MYPVNETSRLCQDIHELEKDFRYNLFLLNVRDAEIASCKSQNEKLLLELKRREQASRIVHLKLKELDEELMKVNSEKTKIKTSSEHTLAKLSDELAISKRACEQYQHNIDMEVQQMKCEFERVYTNKMRDKESEFRDEMVEIKTRLQKAIYSINKLQTSLKEITNENIKLRTQFQENQSFFTSKIAILDSELKSHESEKQTLLNKYKIQEEQYNLIKTNLNNKLQERELKLSETLNTLKTIETKFETVSKDKNDLETKLELFSQDLEMYREKLNKTQAKYDELQNNLNEMKENENKCAVVEHDTMIKQNLILQQVIKSMRKSNTEEVLDKNETELKINRLEELVQNLKQTMMNNISCGNDTSSLEIE